MGRSRGWGGGRRPSYVATTRRVWSIDPRTGQPQIIVIAPHKVPIRTSRLLELVRDQRVRDGALAVALAVVLAAALAVGGRP